MLFRSRRLFVTGANIFPASSSSNFDVALELGAGCGLVSIWLSKQQYFCRVISTDIELQLPLIDRNIKRNAAQDTCVCKSLDWGNYSEDLKYDGGVEPAITREKSEQRHKSLGHKRKSRVSNTNTNEIFLANSMKSF